MRIGRPQVLELKRLGLDLWLMFSLHLLWFDVWIGAYWDRDKKILYLNPFPCVVFKIQTKKSVLLQELNNLDKLEDIEKMKIVLIGGNPKGFDIPFHPSTRSGKILRDMIDKIELKCELVNMTINSDDVPTGNELMSLYRKYKDFDVIVFLGRFVERECKWYFNKGVYLPHPASRRKKDLERLEKGLKKLKGLK